MNIIEALESSKKFTGDRVRESGCKYWVMGERGYMINQDGLRVHLNESMLTADYEFYEEGIRLKEAGEVWKNPKSLYFVINDGIEMKMVSQAGGKYNCNEFTVPVVHGEYWQRLRPTVQDNDIERVDYEELTAMISDALHEKIQFYSPCGNEDNANVLNEVDKVVREVLIKRFA